ncbi:MAG: hypothetical protein Q8865_00010 [Bacillota bacterium]|nr:hypothetical protein [Bacillota bacterium]
MIPAKNGGKRRIQRDGRSGDKKPAKKRKKELTWRRKSDILRFPLKTGQTKGYEKTEKSRDKKPAKTLKKSVDKEKKVWYPKDPGSRE